MILVSAVYPNRPGSRFDRDYYLKTHAPLATRLLQPFGLRRSRIALGETDLAGNAPAYWAIGELYFESRAAFDDAMQRSGAALGEDVRKFTDVDPVLQFATLHE